VHTHGVNWAGFKCTSQTDLVPRFPAERTIYEARRDRHCSEGLRGNEQCGSSSSLSVNSLIVCMLNSGSSFVIGIERSCNAHPIPRAQPIISLASLMPDTKCSVGSQISFCDGAIQSLQKVGPIPQKPLVSRRLRGSHAVITFCQARLSEGYSNATHGRMHTSPVGKICRDTPLSASRGPGRRCADRLPAKRSPRETGR
jgi:hypothetical protein